MTFLNPILEILLSFYVSIYSEIATVEKLSFQLSEATLLKLKDLLTHAKKCFVVDLVQHFFIFEKIRAFSLFFNFVTPYLKSELLGYFFAKALIDSK